MKNVIKMFLAVSLIFSAVGCTEKTQYGKCIGVNQEENPTKVYKANWWNIFVATMLAETIVVPIVTVLNQYKCPEGDK